MLALGVIFAVIALASDSVWGLAAGSVRQWFAAGGLAIVGLGVRLAFSRRADRTVPTTSRTLRWVSERRRRTRVAAAPGRVVRPPR